MMNTIIEGNLTADPEVRNLNDGTPVASFTVAYTASKKNRQTDEWEDEGTAFVRVSVWDKLVETVVASLTKGNRVIVSGPMKVRQYETNDGEKRDSIEMTANMVGASLRRQTAVVEKYAPNGGGSAWSGAKTGSGFGGMDF